MLLLLYLATLNYQSCTGGIPNVQGVVVVDVVEGTALASLSHMNAVLQARPRSFPTPNAAIQWSLRSGMCHNPEAACISVPAMLTQQPVGPPEGPPESEGALGALATLAEEGDDDNWDSNASHAAVQREDTTGASTPWVWRTPLGRSAAYWEGWYSGLSAAFLQLPQPKVLIVAGTDRMDKPLMIGQMQGKFQFVLLPQVMRMDVHYVSIAMCVTVACRLGMLCMKMRQGALRMLCWSFWLGSASGCLLWRCPRRPWASVGCCQWSQDRLFSSQTSVNNVNKVCVTGMCVKRCWVCLRVLYKSKRRAASAFSLRNNQLSSSSRSCQLSSMGCETKHLACIAALATRCSATARTRWMANGMLDAN